MDNKILNSYQAKTKEKKYEFNYMIRTNGVQLSVLFIRLDENGKPKPHGKQPTTTPTIS